MIVYYETDLNDFNFVLRLQWVSFAETFFFLFFLNFLQENEEKSSDL